MANKKIFFVVLTKLLFASVVVLFLTTTINAQTTGGKQKQSASDGDVKGYGIRLSPAFFWNSLGLEFEVPIINRISVGLNVNYKLGRTDGEESNYKVKQENFLENGYLIDLVARYYIFEAPKGLFAQVGATYGDMLFYDGTARPFSMNHNPKEFVDLRTVTSIGERSSVKFNLGMGYQILIPKRKIGASLFGGIMVDSDKTKNKTLLTLYLAPSLGLMF